MLLTMMKGKIHRATVTDANLDYVGSITIDKDLMDAANILENEKVQVLNLTNGKRFETYAIPGKRGKGDICINGAAAHKASKDDMVIIIAYANMGENEAKMFKPSVVMVDGKNIKKRNQSR